MQYVRSISGSVSKTWNSINPATLSGAIDVIVVEHEDGTLACSPFHVRFGKFSLLRPHEKKVDFKVNGVRQDFPMKLGEGGEAFFVFETSNNVPAALQTSPLVSPATSPDIRPVTPDAPPLTEPELFDLELQSDSGRRRKTLDEDGMGGHARSKSDADHTIPPFAQEHSHRPTTADGLGHDATTDLRRVALDPALNVPKIPMSQSFDTSETFTKAMEYEQRMRANRSASPPASSEDAMTRAINLSKKLWVSNIASQVTDTGDLMLDMTGYKSSDEEALKTEIVARKILSEEFEGNYDIGSLIAPDEKGNIWIYSSEEAKEKANRKITDSMQGLKAEAFTVTSDAASDPGYHSDDARSESDVDIPRTRERHDSDSAVGMSPPLESPGADTTRNYAKTLRLTSDQLKELELHPGQNSVSFSVNRATCTASIYLWRYDVPIVISDIDGTITKSDALGHVLNMIGRDWTHLGVAKLYTEIEANGYNILYLTSRSVGQADTTRAYLTGVVQDGGFKLPKGPVIMSPDRTIAALRREIYLRKPEVFKMACLRDIMSLFTAGSASYEQETGGPDGEGEASTTTKLKTSPFYAGFGNRFTDALSYRSVNIPSTRIFTINSNSEVSLDLLSLNTYKTGYASMREIVDHFFPPVGLLIKQGGEEFTDFNYWRDKPLEIDDFSASESEDDSDDDIEEEEYEDDDEDDDPLSGVATRILSEDEAASYFSDLDARPSLEASFLESVEGDDRPVPLVEEPEEVYESFLDEEEQLVPGEDEHTLTVRTDILAQAAAMKSPRGPLPEEVQGQVQGQVQDEKTEEH